MRKFRSSNVIKERVELYKDFTINLLYNIYNTYLGDDFISSDEDIKGHFTWAFNKMIEEFYDEDIIFFKTNDLFDYFYEYYYSHFYKLGQSQSFSYYKNFWENIFDLKNQKKDKKVFDVLIQIYELFDNSLSEKIQIQEILV